MRILHYIPTYAPAWSFGGTVRAAADVCEGLAQRGHEVTVVTTDAGLHPDLSRPPGRPVLRNGVKVIYCPTAPGLGIRSPAAESCVRENIRHQDIAHVTGVWQRTAPAACRAAKRAGVPYVISPHGALSGYSWSRGRLKKLLYYFLYERRNAMSAAGIHATSRMEEEECQRYGFPGILRTIPNPANVDFWVRQPEAGRAWRASLGLREGERVALYTGRFEPKKNLEFMIPVLARAPGWRLVLLGFENPRFRDRLLAEAGAAGVAARVMFLPPADPEGLRAAYSGADVFSLPSRHENFCISALEAWLCGCPLLLSPWVGLAGELGAVSPLVRVAPVDPVGWAAELSRLPESGPPWETHNLRACFSVETVAREMEGFYREFLGAVPEER